MSGEKPFRELFFLVAIVAGIVGAIMAHSAFVNEPLPETPSVFEEVTLRNVYMILFLVPTAFAQWALYLIELLRIWWIVILCGIGPFVLVCGLNKIIGLVSKSKG